MPENVGDRFFQTRLGIQANLFEWICGLEPEVNMTQKKHQRRCFVDFSKSEAKDEATIHFTLQRPGNTAIQFTDNLGRTVKALPLCNVASGKHEIAAELSGLSKGLFIGTLEVDGEVVGRVKMVVN